MLIFVSFLFDLVCFCVFLVCFSVCFCVFFVYFCMLFLVYIVCYFVVYIVVYVCMYSLYLCVTCLYYIYIYILLCKKVYFFVTFFMWKASYFVWKVRFFGVKSLFLLILSRWCFWFFLLSERILRYISYIKVSLCSWHCSASIYVKIISIWLDLNTSNIACLELPKYWGGRSYKGISCTYDVTPFLRLFTKVPYPE